MQYDGIPNSYKKVMGNINIQTTPEDILFWNKLAQAEGQTSKHHFEELASSLSVSYLEAHRAEQEEHKKQLEKLSNNSLLRLSERENIYELLNIIKERIDLANKALTLKQKRK